MNCRRRTTALSAFGRSGHFRCCPQALRQVGDPGAVHDAGAAANQDAFKPLTEVVGSGPFRFVADDRVQGARNVYARFDRYRPREGGTRIGRGAEDRALRSRVWTTMPDAATALRPAYRRAGIGRNHAA